MADISTIAFNGTEYNIKDENATALANQAIQAVNTEAENRQAEIAVERARINQIVSLDEGSTTGDAELVDIRVGCDGTIYDTAGTAVRTQVNNLKSDIVDFQNDISIRFENGKDIPLAQTYSEFVLDGSGGYISQSGYKIVHYRVTDDSEYLFLNVPYCNNYVTCEFHKSGSLNSDTLIEVSSRGNINGYVKIPSGTANVYITMSTDSEDITIKYAKKINGTNDAIYELSNKIKFANYNLTEKLPAETSWVGMELDGNGGWVWTNNVNIERYLITEDFNKVYLNVKKRGKAVYEFHSDESLKPESLIGESFTDSIDGFIDIPPNALYLYVCYGATDEKVVKGAVNVLQELTDKVNSLTNESIEDIVPKDLYAMVGVPYYIYTDAILETIDNVYYPSQCYEVVYKCNIGKVTNRGFYVLSNEESNSVLTITVYNSNKKIIKTITTNIHIVANSFNGLSANVLVIGDSTEHRQKYVKPSKLFIDEHNGNGVVFVGSKKNETVNNCADEGYGGATFKSFTESGSLRLYLYRAEDSSENVSIDNKYSITTPKGVGYVTISEISNIVPRYISGTVTPPTNVSIIEFVNSMSDTGVIVLSSGNGSENVSYTSKNVIDTNPFINPTSSLLDIDYYKNKIGVEKINVACIILGINDMDWNLGVEPTITRAITLYNFFAQEVDTVIIGLTTDCCSTISGFGNHYGAKSNIAEYRKRMFALRKALNTTFSDITTYPKAKIMMLGGTIDRYYGYSHKEEPQYYYEGITEFEHIDSKHPNENGRKQGSMTLTAMIKGVLTN